MKYELNRRLLTELLKSDIDPLTISSLMSEGADPLGHYDEDEEESVLASLILDICDATALGTDAAEMYKGLEEKLAVLLDNGLDLSKMPASSKKGESTELWTMSFLDPERIYGILELLIRNNVPAGAIEDYVEHSYTDLWLRSSAESLAEHPDDAKGIYKSIFFAASFPEVLDSSGYIKDIIELDLNGNDRNNLPLFRNHDEIDVFFDVSTKDHISRTVRGTAVNLVYRPTSEKIWTTHI